MFCLLLLDVWLVQFWTVGLINFNFNEKKLRCYFFGKLGTPRIPVRFPCKCTCGSFITWPVRFIWTWCWIRKNSLSCSIGSCVRGLLSVTFSSDWPLTMLITYPSCLFSFLIRYYFTWDFLSFPSFPTWLEWDYSNIWSQKFLHISRCPIIYNITVNIN